MMKIAGKTALVTGGGRRLGREIALTLAKNGADIIIHYLHSQNEAQQLSAEIRKMGRKSATSSHNLSDTENTGKWFARIIEEWGCPDILINSASDYSEDTYQTMSIENLQNSMNVHVYSPLVMMRMMFERGGGGTVVNLLDSRVADRDPAHASYHLGKRALLTITRDLAVEFAPSMRINAVAPGIILPPEGKGEQWLNRMKKTNPLGKIGSPREIADAVLFLVESEFTTGQVVFIDGGRLLKGNAYGL